MIDAYIVCGFCFKVLGDGKRCDCKESTGKEQKICRRYADLMEIEEKYSPQDIHGGFGPVGSLAENVKATLTLAPDVTLCERCQEEFDDACRSLLDIINSCGDKSRCKKNEDKGNV